MPNQYVNKVQQSNGTVLIDITDTTAVASDVATGKYFYLATGEKVEGTSSGGGTPAISVVDTTDSHGGTVREITALDISDTTAVASDVAQGKYFYTAQGVKTAGTGSGGTPSATQHSIIFGFSDGTDTDIDVYYDDSILSSIITSYTPTTYSGKSVDSASLDGVQWYERWTTVHEGRYTPMTDSGVYFWIPAMASVIPMVGEVWRITIDNTSYVCTATQNTSAEYITNYCIIGNPLYIGGQDDGSGVPFCFYNYARNAWSGDTSSSVISVTEHYVKIEKENI